MQKHWRKIKMTKQPTKEKLKEIIKSCTSVIYEDIEITDSTDIITELVFDSITLMQLVVEIEEEFEILFDDDLKYEDISSFLLLFEYITKKSIEKENDGKYKKL